MGNASPMARMMRARVKLHRTAPRPYPGLPIQPVPWPDEDRTRAPDRTTTDGAGARGWPRHQRSSPGSPRRAASTACGSTTTSCSASRTSRGRAPRGMDAARRRRRGDRAGGARARSSWRTRLPAAGHHWRRCAATADEIASGRLILGLGAGWHEPEYTAFGYPFDHRVGRFEEALEIILPLLAASG